MATRTNFINRYRSAVNGFLNSIDALEAITAEHDILTWTFVDADIPAADITASQFEAGVTSFKAVYTAFIGSANAKNIHLLRQ